MSQIDYYFSPLSPFCYLAGLRLEEIAARHGVEIRYLPLDARALIERSGGTNNSAASEARKSYRTQDLRRQAARLGMPIDLAPPFYPTNPVPAAYAIIAAQKAGGAVGALVHGFTKAVWSEGQNIADDGVIRAVLSQHGFDPTLADKGLFTGAETYERNLEAALTAGAFGVPFYVVGDERFFGQDRLDDLDAYLGTRT